MIWGFVGWQAVIIVVSLLTVIGASVWALFWGTIGIIREFNKKDSQ
jgi:hypothetical protein